MGAVKNYLINHPEIIEMQKADEAYRLREQEIEWMQQEHERLEFESQQEIDFLNTELVNDSFNQKQNYATA